MNILASLAPELNALLRLLDDPNERVAAAVEEKIPPMAKRR